MTSTISVKTNFRRGLKAEQRAYKCANELFKIEISRVLWRSNLIEFRCIPRSNTVPFATRDNRPAIKSDRGSDFNFAACRTGTDAFTVTASNNLADACWRICGIGSNAEQIESGVTKLITFFPSLFNSLARARLSPGVPFRRTPTLPTILFSNL